MLEITSKKPEIKGYNSILLIEICEITFEIIIKKLQHIK